MRLPIVTILTLLLSGLLLDWRIVSIIKRRLESEHAARVYMAVNGVVFYGLFLAAVFIPHRLGSESQLLAVMWMLFGYVSIFLAKLVFVAVDVFSLIPKLWGGKRWRFISKTAFAAGVVVFGMMWWGALVNRFNIDVKRTDIEIAGLPASFEGMKIAQFSDLHIGTFGNDTSFVSQLVDSINSLAPDVIVFTGDIVNRKSDELKPFVNVLSRLHAPMGVYSILGNHDYGDYVLWKTEDEKAKNFANLTAMQAQMGWRLLRDESVYLVNGTDTITLIGVDNIGEPPFHCYGNLSKAVPDSAKTGPWVLLTHNPVHWDREVLKQTCDSLPIALTLSGHTHAMQMELWGKSPVALRYDRWGGLYENEGDGRKLYINIGSGTVGMPMRVGATPEISLLTLHGKR